MSYKLAICDDNPVDIEYVSRLVHQWAQNTQASIQIDTFLSAEAFLFQYEEDKSYDILLLDVEMGTMDGASLAKKLRKENETLQIIFITGYTDYISEGYEVAALHYLLKPVKPEKLFDVLRRATEKLQKNERVLTFDIGKEMVRIPIYQIRYAEVQHNYITLHARETVILKMSLSDLMEQLDERFYRVGRSSIVNLTEISRVTKTDIHLQSGDTIPLPRGAYEGVNRAIIQLGR